MAEGNPASCSVEPGGVDADRVTETWWLIGGLGGRPDPNLFSRKEMALHRFVLFFSFFQQKLCHVPVPNDHQQQADAQGDGTVVSGTWGPYGGRYLPPEATF